MNLLDEIDRADLMCGDTVAAHIQSRAVIPVEPNLVPLCFRHGGDIEGWLEHRAIDAHRTHSRLLKKVLRLRKRDDLSTALHFNAATIMTITGYGRKAVILFGRTFGFAITILQTLR